MGVIKDIEEKYLNKDVAKFKVGDTIRVFSKIKEGDKERIQAFEGIVIKMQNGGIGRTFTVRKMVQAIGVERTFPLHSPKITKINLVKSGQVRRAKLYYLRGRIGSSATRVNEEQTSNESKK